MICCFHITFYVLSRVHGIKNLRVIDASILPTPISGYPNLVVVGLATRGAAMILKDHKRYIEN